MKRTAVLILVAFMTGCGWCQAQTMKEVPTGLNNVKLYAGSDRFEVKTVSDGRIVAYGRLAASVQRAAVSGYSNQIPPAMLWWLGVYDRELEFAKESVGSEQWATGSRRKAAGDSLAPLITSRWRQYIGYNRYCPVDTSLANLGGHPTTGCVATAMAQIMRYWQFPQHGMGSNSYSHDYECWRYGVVSADFANTQYDWEYMPEVLTDSSSEREIDAVATLCYQCGVSVNMMYNNDCSGSSGAYSAHAATAFTNTFHYKPSHCLNRNNYSASQWAAILKNELNNGRPVLYGGQSIEDTARGIGGGGHAFIADGYDTNGYFHINWGWGGWYDGYFAISMLNPAERYEFNYGQQAVIGVEPEFNALAVPVLAQGIDLDGEDFQMGGNVRGSYAVANVGDTVYDGYIGVNIYSPETYNFYGWLDATEVHIQPGDTVFRTFDNPGMTRPVGIYYAIGQYNDTPLYVTDQVDNALTCFNNGQAYFKSVDTNRTELRNVTVCVSFADEDEWLDKDPNELMADLLVSEGDYFSLHNYVYATTEGRTHLRSLIAYDDPNDTILTFADTNRRGHYQPYRENNPEGYVGDQDRASRINDLIGNIIQTLNERRRLEYDLLIDGDGDGNIDLLTVIFKDGEPILEIDNKPLAGIYTGEGDVNNRRVGHYTIANENSDVSGLCYGAMRMLGLPDMSHQQAYTDISTLGEWDIMDRPNHQQPSYILKHKYLNIGAAPTVITESGWYTLGDGVQCFEVPISEAVSYMLEMRDQSNIFDQGVPASGLTVARWNNEGDNNHFDNVNTPNQYWMMRSGSTSDTVQGDLATATVTELRTYPITDTTFFTIDSVSTANGQTTFKLSFSTDGQENPDPNPNPNAIELSNIQTFNLYPNPTTGMVYIDAEGEAAIEVLTATGQRLLSTKSQAIDLRTLAPGVYIVRVTTTEGSTVKKVVKK